MDPLSVFSLAGGLLILSAVFSFLASSMSSGQLVRNSAVGIKTRHTLASDQAWLAGHLAAAATVRKAGLAGWAVLLGVAVLCGFKMWPWAMGLTGIGYLSLIGLMFVATSKANKAAHLVGNYDDD